MTKPEATKDKLVGNVKSAAGKAVDDPQLEASGKKDQLKGKAKQTAADLKDKAAEKFNDVVDRHQRD